MNEPIHILITCRSEELIPAATLVFKTLPIGFPDSKVYVWESRNFIYRCDEIRDAVAAAGANWVGKPEWRDHDDWIAHLIASYRDPFWICDTDVVFWNKFEHEPDGSALAGVRTPSFFEPWARAQYRERLHTCLMRIDPNEFRDARARYLGRVRIWPFHPKIDLVSQQWQPERIGDEITHHFYDTLAMAWHAFGGQEFTQAQIESFDHLNCATYADLIAPSQDFDMLAAHKAVYANPAILRGAWASQLQWFREHSNAAAA